MLSQPAQAVTSSPGAACVSFLLGASFQRVETPLSLSEVRVGAAPFHPSQGYKGGCGGEDAIQAEPMHVKDGCLGPCLPWRDRDRAEGRCLGRKKPRLFSWTVQTLCQRNQMSCARMPECSCFICFLRWAVRKPENEDGHDFQLPMERSSLWRKDRAELNLKLRSKVQAESGSEGF